MFSLRNLVIKLSLTLLFFVSISGASVYYLYQTVVINKPLPDETEMVPVYGLIENDFSRDGKVAILPLKKGMVTPRQVVAGGGPLLENFSNNTIFSSLVSGVGIVSLTNRERSSLGLAPLAVNNKLNTIAELKLTDMVNLQYFEHLSPTGKGIGQFALEGGYDYVFIGENLAMGHFLDDEAIVLAWMNSLSHRENILNKNYREIGVASRVVTFKDQAVLLAVQVFGKPLVYCALPDKALHGRIITNQAELTELKIELTELENKLTAKNLNQKEQQILIENYNELVSSFNNLNKVTEASIIAYNQEVSRYNYCISN